ncbi:MAG TPA: HAMP domain-containing sensor histidine kinase [Solirubrobacteraceae bacterium]|jgi:two-component system sensor histidine kinase MprB|nr:HAMP domain-containing sensor histidine kinase [Solirubrobacteraceae bacterium]
MSLQRRIAAAAAFGVAAVCLIFAPVGYLSTRAKLYQEVRNELVRLAAPYLQPPHGGADQPHGGGSSSGGTGSPAGGNPGPGANQGGDDDDADNGNCAFKQPPANGGGDSEYGGVTGSFQVVCPNGTVLAKNGTKPKLPVTQRVKTVASTLMGSYFFTAKVGPSHTHLEIYVTPDKGQKHAIEVAVPLTTTDAALQGLLVTYGLLLGVGMVLAAWIGALVARAALAPIRRFTSQTEQITSALDKPRRIDEVGAIEIRRMAASFNQTLGALERSVEAQRHLIADASHELRTPIAALRSNIQIFLEADQLPADDQAELRDAILAELDDLTQLVSDVLALARGSTPNEVVDELELDAIVSEATERAIRRSQNVTFNVELEPTLITNSPDRVTRAVTNIVDNARKWSPPEGTVEITLAGGVLTVRDHGPGFRAEDLAHVFERFYRSDDARRMPGSGLGLAIVKQAAEAYGGYAIVSNAPDGGAVVTVSFGSARIGSSELPRVGAD